MEFVQQNINIQKAKLLNLINKLNTTIILDQEMLINSEIKKECDILFSFLNEKQKYLLNPMVMNNNINPMFQQNMMMNIPQMNMNPIQMPQAQLFNNNQNNFENYNQDRIINLKFEQKTAPFETYIVQCRVNERICDIIEKYRKKANDYNDNFFLRNWKDLNGLSSTLKEKNIIDFDLIEVHRKGDLKGGKYTIHTFN